jgi:hypothetical protein
VNIQKFTVLLLETLADSAGRELGPSITGATWFTELPPEEDRAGLQKAAAGIGEMLSSGAGEVSPFQLAKALDLWHSMHGSTWCPPLKEIAESLG